MLYFFGVLAGGLSIVILYSLYFVFSFPRFVKYQESGWKTGLVLFGFGALFWYAVTLFYTIELMDFCARTILNITTKSGKLELFAYFFFLFLAPTQIYWVVKKVRKQKEIDKNKKTNSSI